MFLADMIEYRDAEKYKQLIHAFHHKDPKLMCENVFIGKIKKATKIIWNMPHVTFCE